MADDLDLRDTAEVRRRVAMPVARSLLRADELEDVVVEVVVDYRPALGRVNALRVAVQARGEWIEAGHWILDDSPWDAQSFADWLYSFLQDELTKSRVAWGEIREGTFEVLPPERLEGSHRGRYGRLGVRLLSWIEKDQHASRVPHDVRETAVSGY